MKNIIYLAILTIFCCCTEVPVEINHNPFVDPIYTELQNQGRNVLIEEFTGVSCVNCPAGSASLKNLVTIHGDRLIPVSIHAGFFSRLFAESVQDLKVEDGQLIVENLLGEPIGYPAAAINRKKFEGTTELSLGETSWAGAIAKELLTESPFGMKVDANLDGMTDQININLEIFTKSLPLNNDIRLTVGLTQSGIVEAQKTLQGVDVDYIHEYVLIDILTPFNGEPVSEKLIEGMSINKNYSYSTTVDVNDLEVFAFLHQIGNSLEVYQAVKGDIIQ